jgi:putative ABC transport system ATP-binding protein
MLDVRNLTKIYGLGEVQVRALDGVSFTVATGDMVCIMGKSGSGKSTLLRQLGLLDRPTSGEIILDDKFVTKLSDSARATLRLQYLGYVFQEYALLAELTAHENVYLPGMMLGEKGTDFRKRAKELLELVGLGHRIRHYPKELSGGEQQRVAISPDATIEEALVLAQMNQSRSFLVMNNSHLAGIVTTNDFFYNVLNPMLGINKPGTMVLVH